MGILNSVYEIIVKRKPCFGNYKYGKYQTLCEGAIDNCCRDAGLCRVIYEGNIKNGSSESTNSNTIAE